MRGRNGIIHTFRDVPISEFARRVDCQQPGAGNLQKYIWHYYFELARRKSRCLTSSRVCPFRLCGLFRTDVKGPGISWRSQPETLLLESPTSPSDGGPLAANHRRSPCIALGQQVRHDHCHHHRRAYHNHAPSTNTRPTTATTPTTPKLTGAPTSQCTQRSFQQPRPHQPRERPHLQPDSSH